MKSTVPEIGAELKNLEQFYDKKLNEQKLEYYIGELAKYPIHQIRYSLDRCRREYKFLPSLSEIVGILDDLNTPRAGQIDNEEYPCDLCNRSGLRQVWTMMDGSRRVPNSPEWVFPGRPRVEPPDPDATMLIARCECLNGRRYAGLPLYQGKFKERKEVAVGKKSRNEEVNIQAGSGERYCSPESNPLIEE
jgi:hypothetical protein